MYIEQTSALNIHTVIHCRFESTSGFLFDTVPVCLGNSNPVSKWEWRNENFVGRYAKIRNSNRWLWII